MVEFIQDRRSHPRLKHNIPLKLFQEDGDIVTETADISRAGIYCEVHRALDLMTKVKIRLLLPIRRVGKKATKQISCEGVIVRTEPAAKLGFYHAAIFFNDITQKDADAIADYVNTCLERESALS
jgi:hypothetical protein